MFGRTAVMPEIEPLLQLPYEDVLVHPRHWCLLANAGARCGQRHLGDVEDRAVRTAPVASGTATRRGVDQPAAG
jgi:hypothetical protein